MTVIVEYNLLLQFSGFPLLSLIPAAWLFVRLAKIFNNFSIERVQYSLQRKIFETGSNIYGKIFDAHG